MKIFQKIRRYFNPTFKEWSEDLINGFNKEIKNPKVQKALGRILGK